MAILLRIVFSWISMDPSNPIYTITHDITEPILAPIRQFMPRMMFDFSPMVASILLIIILQAARSIG